MFVFQIVVYLEKRAEEYHLGPYAASRLPQAGELLVVPLRDAPDLAPLQAVVRHVLHNVYPVYQDPQKGYQLAAGTVVKEPVIELLLWDLAVINGFLAYWNGQKEMQERLRKRNISDLKTEDMTTPRKQ